MNKTELVSQTKLAFDFVQKLYFEVSYLIKEIEGLLSEEEEHFVFGRASGYAVTARSSNGLDPILVNMWMYKKLAVFFIPKDMTHIEKGRTVTHYKNNPKLLYMRIILDDKDLPEPTIYYGILKDFQKKNKSWPDKLEYIMGSIEYNEAKLFSQGEDVNYEDASVAFKGKLGKVNLYDLNTSDDIAKKLIQPALKMYREN